MYFYLLIIILVTGCTSSNSIEEIENNPSKETVVSNDNCYNIIGVSSMDVNCDRSLSFTVVRHSDFLKGGPFNHNQRILVCVKGTEYTMNDFKLGKLVCDYSIYQ